MGRTSQGHKGKNHKKEQIESTLKQQHKRIKQLFNTRREKQHGRRSDKSASVKKVLDMIEESHYVAVAAATLDTLQLKDTWTLGYSYVWLKYDGVYSDMDEYIPFIQGAVSGTKDSNKSYIPDSEFTSILKLLEASPENCQIVVLTHQAPIVKLAKRSKPIMTEEEIELNPVKAQVISLLASKKLTLTVFEEGSKDSFIRGMHRVATELALAARNKLIEDQISEAHIEQQPQEKKSIDERRLREGKGNKVQGKQDKVINKTDWTELERQKPHIRSTETMQQWITDTFKYIP